MPSCLYLPTVADDGLPLILIGKINRMGHLESIVHFRITGIQKMSSLREAIIAHFDWKCYHGGCTIFNKYGCVILRSSDKKKMVQRSGIREELKFVFESLLSFLYALFILPNLYQLTSGPS